MRTALYRHFNNEGSLLYVGISLSAVNRLGQHKRNSSWFDEITRIEIEHFSTRAQAAMAEIIAIHDESPRHNKSRLLKTIVVLPSSDPDLSYKYSVKSAVSPRY